MFPRIISILPHILLSLFIFCCIEMFWFAMDRLLFAAEAADCSIARRDAAEPCEGILAAGITDRNLFGLPPEGKKEEAAVSVPLAPLPETSLDLVLMGIVGGGSRDSRAVILSKKDKKQQIYQVGDMVAGARVKSILWGVVVLGINGRDEILDMSETASYRAREIPAPGAIREKNIASSDDGDISSRLIPERVRLVLPDQGGGDSQQSE